MKYKITIKELKNSSDLILNVGNGNIQTLLKYLSPYGYNYGCYGWNFDVYYFDNVDIISGYRCFKSGTLQPDFIVMRNYEERAKMIDNDRSLSYEETKEKILNLLSEFINLYK